ncbi:DODA-type extradiol aromatic ring-opening family dioxygenase [Pseudoalteromonas sp. SSDWG2]|uniref:DODA-type extradiol aromatic ring-opening family dioxygenase n=1 Tax=Pseudoalteromonas sp. SSDWG2 TaxID=3139391 RepID=UPI003BAB0721
MVNTLQKLAASIAKPTAIIAVSAHWETPGIFVNTRKHLELLYDYYGFPEQAYAIEYPLFGESHVAQQVIDALNNLDVPVEAETHRGIDHGVFVPLAIMYPSADIPCVQVSIHQDYDPQLHIEVGKRIAAAISHLDNVLVLGSGFSFHNMKAFWQPDEPHANNANRAFEAWLAELLTGPISERERIEQLIAWDKAPGARLCHPTEEHLLPLHVAYGAAQSTPTTIEQVDVVGKLATFALWSIPNQC